MNIYNRTMYVYDAGTKLKNSGTWAVKNLVAKETISIF